jgi:hypothetical protein
MNSANDVIARLGTLAEADRAWILEQLPPAAKALLLDEPAQAHAVPVVEAQPLNESEEQSIARALARAEAQCVCHVLSKEPCWVIAAVLQIRSWPWRDEVLRGLPEWQRLEVTQLETRAAFTVQMSDTLSRLLLQRVTGSELPPPESRFAKLVSKLSSSRVRRRLSVHL